MPRFRIVLDMRTAEGKDDDFGEGVDELEDLLAGGFFLGLVGQLQRQFRQIPPADIEDAVLEALQKMVQRLKTRGPVRDARKYLATIAYNCCNKASKQPVHLEIPERDAREITVENSVLQNAAIELIKTEVRSWENAHIREVISVYVEMIVTGELLEADEIAEIVSVNLGEQISVMSVSQWKARGLRKLREFIEGSDWFDRRRSTAKEETG